jgi:hypothetical protein
MGFLCFFHVPYFSVNIKFAGCPVKPVEPVNKRNSSVFNYLTDQRANGLNHTII